MAGAAKVVEQIVLLTAWIVCLFPQRGAVGIFQVQVVMVALVHPADGAEHGQRLARLPVFERNLDGIFRLHALDVRLRQLFRLLYRQEELQLLGRHRPEIHLYVLVVPGVPQIDDVGDDGLVRPVARPGVGILRLQRRSGEIGSMADRRRHVGGELQMQHLLDEHREDDIECGFIRRLRPGSGGGAGPQAVLIKCIILAGDLVHTLN